MAYSGRRAPNVSEYIANLNAIPSAQDLQNVNQDGFREDDLAMFTNAQFFDFERAQEPDFNTESLELDGLGGHSVADSVDMNSLDFNVSGDFSFPGFQSYDQHGSFGSDGLQSIPAVQSDHAYPPPSSAASPTSGLSSSSTGEKRKADSSEDGVSKVAAEEDKRRRNTAASARFRVKKKQREQALEKSAKEMSDKVAALEGRINQLETENKWLKNLITEKHETKEGVEALWSKFNQDNIDRKASGRKDGVGTKAKA